jgi:hypothetical protein
MTKNKLNLSTVIDQNLRENFLYNENISGMIEDGV